MAQKAIGPNFGNELAAAGLAGLAISWNPLGEILRGPALTDAQWAAVQAVYAAHAPSKADPLAAGAALLAGGLAITSTSTPALNGTYGCGMQDEINAASLQGAVSAGVFPGFYRDQAGVRHVMTGLQFTAIATAIMTFIVAVEEAKAMALGGGAWAPPATAVTLA
jgi:hypothetical protein